MRLPMILHSALIFFSCVLAYLLVPLSSIVLFVAGLFFMLVAVGTAYCIRTHLILVYSSASTLFAVLVILYVSWAVPLVSVAIGLLDFFYVLQAFFWPLALLPLIARQYYVHGKSYSAVASAFILSVLAALLSLVTAFMLVYAAMYLVFCVVLVWVLGREYGVAGSNVEGD